MATEEALLGRMPDEGAADVQDRAGHGKLVAAAPLFVP